MHQIYQCDILLQSCVLLVLFTRYVGGAYAWALRRTFAIFAATHCLSVLSMQQSLLVKHAGSLFTSCKRTTPYTAVCSVATLPGNSPLYVFYTGLFILKGNYRTMDIIKQQPLRRRQATRLPTTTRACSLHSRTKQFGECHHTHTHNDSHSTTPLLCTGLQLANGLVVCVLLWLRATPELRQRKVGVATQAQ